MTLDSAGPAIVVPPLIHEAAGFQGGDPSAASDSVVSDSVVADTDASGDVSGQQGEHAGFPSLLYTATSALQSCTAEPHLAPELCTHADPAHVHPHPREQPSQVEPNAKKQAIVNSAAEGQSSGERSHHSHCARASAPTPSHNNLEPAIASGIASEVTPAAGVGHDDAVYEATMALQPAAGEIMYAHPAAADDASSVARHPHSASYSSPACLESLPLTPYLQQMLWQSRRAQSCTAVPDGDAAHMSRLQQAATRQKTGPTPAPQLPTASPAAACDVDAAASEGGAQAQDSCAALASPVHQQGEIPPLGCSAIHVSAVPRASLSCDAEHVSHISEDREHTHSATEPSRAEVLHVGAGGPQHALPVAGPAPEQQACSHPAQAQHAPEECDLPAVNSCATDQEVLEADLCAPCSQDQLQPSCAPAPCSATAVTQHTPVAKVSSRVA